MADVCRSCGIDTAAYGGGIRMSDGTVRCPGCETLVRLKIIDEDGGLIARVPHADHANMADVAGYVDNDLEYGGT